MNIQFFKPKNERLSEFIDGFYFISDKETLTSNGYWTFPNNFCLATVCLDAELIPEKERITIRKSGIEKTDSFLFFNIPRPVEVKYEVPINEITIYFKPLAIFHFFPDVDLKVNTDHHENFEPYPDYLSVMRRILKMNIKDDQAMALEEYLLSKFNYRRMDMAGKILQKIEEGARISEVAKELGISRQYLNRTFFKFAGKSPSEYRKIHRFREIIASQVTGEKFISLSYKNSFFDQPHFNRDFKELTGTIPTLFFKNVDTSKKMLWLFV